MPACCSKTFSLEVNNPACPEDWFGTFSAETEVESSYRNYPAILSPARTMSRNDYASISFTRTGVGDVRHTVRIQGVATGGAGATLVDATKNWPVNCWKGKRFYLFAGTARRYMIVSNTANSITVHTNFDVAVTGESYAVMAALDTISVFAQTQSWFLAPADEDYYYEAIANGSGFGEVYGDTANFEFNCVCGSKDRLNLYHPSFPGCYHAATNRVFCLAHQKYAGHIELTGINATTGDIEVEESFGGFFLISTAYATEVTAGEVILTDSGHIYGCYQSVGGGQINEIIRYLPLAGTSTLYNCPNSNCAVKNEANGEVYFGGNSLSLQAINDTTGVLRSILAPVAGLDNLISACYVTSTQEVWFGSSGGFGVGDWRWVFIVTAAETYDEINPPPIVVDGRNKGICYVPSTDRVILSRDNHLYKIVPATRAIDLDVDFTATGAYGIYYDSVTNGVFVIGNNNTAMLVSPVTLEILATYTCIPTGIGVTTASGIRRVGSKIYAFGKCIIEVV